MDSRTHSWAMTPGRILLQHLLPVCRGPRYCAQMRDELPVNLRLKRRVAAS